VIYPNPETGWQAGERYAVLKITESQRNGNCPFVAQGEVGQTLDELARAGAQRMIAAALEMEVEAYLALYREVRDTAGRAQVVRNGRARARKIALGAGTVEVQAPRVNDKRRVEGKRQRFISRILKPYLRRSAKVTELLPVLYLHGLSTGDFREALAPLLGADAAGLSPAEITRLTQAWQAEREAWCTRPLAGLDYVYFWVDGVHFNVRLEEDRLAALVVLGVRPDGTKELVAIEDGYRESTESWLSVLRDLKERGMKAPVLAIGDGALGFWKAVGEVWPETQQQTCWVHKIANVLDKLPSRLQPAAKRQLHEMMYAESRAQCEVERNRFIAEYGTRYPKAVNSLNTNWERLLTFYDYPLMHWKHIRSTNPIESAFATVKLRTRVTRGAGSRKAGLAMAFQLLLLAQRRWRTLDAYDLLPLIRSGVRFRDGLPIDPMEGAIWLHKHPKQDAA
jgi:putative transposase